MLTLCVLGSWHGEAHPGLPKGSCGPGCSELGLILLSVPPRVRLCGAEPGAASAAASVLQGPPDPQEEGSRMMQRAALALHPPRARRGHSSFQAAGGPKPPGMERSTGRWAGGGGGIEQHPKFTLPQPSACPLGTALAKNHEAPKRSWGSVNQPEIQPLEEAGG